MARELLTDSGSIFVQIGDENVHRVRALMDEVFGDENCIAQISFIKTSGQSDELLSQVADYILWFSKNIETVKYRQLYHQRSLLEAMDGAYTKVLLPNLANRQLTSFEKINTVLAKEVGRIYRTQSLTSQRPAQGTDTKGFLFQGKNYSPGKGTFKTDHHGLTQLAKSGRIEGGKNSISYIRFANDFPVIPISNFWDDTGWSLGAEKTYVVQTGTTIIQRCILMTTDPGDLVLDPTCGSGTTAYVSEQWGRRWMTIDTSRVALALARARVMGARYPFYLLADSPEGQLKEAEVTRGVPSSAKTFSNIKLGFVYDRVPHITLKSIANNSEIDVIYEEHLGLLEPLRANLNAVLKKNWEEWEIPRETDSKWSSAAQQAHSAWWGQRIARQKAIDASIAAKAEYEYLFDKPFEDKKKVRVAGPFTVESLSPHRVLALDENDELLESSKNPEGRDFVQIILETLRVSGVQQAHKQDKIEFISVVPFAGIGYVCAEGHYLEGEKDRRAAIFIGSEFGTVSRLDLVAAAREAGDNNFDVLIACAFNFDAQSSELVSLGKIPVLKARMNADLHMATDLKNTGKGNLFVIFGEPDIRISQLANNQICVQVLGVDIFRPSTGEVDSSGTDGIACWFIDSDYNEESFFVRQAYFLGQSDPYKALKTTLRAEINEDAWASLNSDTSRPFDKPKTGRIAVKVINHLGDEVMKVFRVN